MMEKFKWSHPRNFDDDEKSQYKRLKIKYHFCQERAQKIMYIFFYSLLATNHAISRMNGVCVYAFSLIFLYESFEKKVFIWEALRLEGGTLL